MSCESDVGGDDVCDERASLAIVRPAFLAWLWMLPVWPVRSPQVRVKALPIVREQIGWKRVPLHKSVASCYVPPRKNIEIGQFRTEVPFLEKPFR